MKILIIGAGLAGTVAQRALSNYDVEIVDKKLDLDIFSNHHAVMRFRDPRLANLLGISLKKVKVYKAFCIDGRVYTKPDIRANNLYSIKTRDALGERSILSCGVYERYIYDGKIRPKDTIGGAVLVNLEKNVATFAETGRGEEFKIDFDYAISTVPIPIALKAALIKHDVEFKANEIWTYTAKLKIPSTVHQTLYFPELEEPFYRVTIEGQNVIGEAMEQAAFEDLDYVIAEYFGVKTHGWAVDEDSLVESTQIGKLIPVDDLKRRALMVELNKLNVYSLGRYATWKSIRADHLVGDIEKIKHFITVSKEVKDYESNINPNYASRERDDNPIPEDKAS